MYKFKKWSLTTKIVVLYISIFLITTSLLITLYFYLGENFHKDLQINDSTNPKWTRSDLISIFSSVATLLAPIGLFFTMYFWKEQEAKKKKAELGLELQRIFHEYAIIICDLEYRYVRKFINNCNNYTAEEKDEFLKKLYEKLLTVKNAETNFLISKTSFYLISNLDKSSKHDIDMATGKLSIVKHCAEEIYEKNNNSVIPNIKSLLEPEIYDIEHIEQANALIIQATLPFVNLE